jgi:hypothetical protein
MIDAQAPKKRTSRKATSNLSEPAPKQPTASMAPTKQECLAALLLRDEGATCEQMVAATGWLPHTTRAAMTGLRKKGYIIDSDKVDGVRTYRAVAPR